MHTFNINASIQLRSLRHVANKKVFIVRKICTRSFMVLGARGGVVVKALRYKLAGHGFDSRWCHWNFSVT